MLSIFLVLVTLIYPCPPDNDPGAEIQAAVQRVFADTEFVLGDTSFSGGDKSVSGTVTFREKHRLGLMAKYDSEDKLGSISLSFPSGNGLGINDGIWRKMAGEQLAPYVPEELASSVRINGVDLFLNKDAEEKFDSIALHFTTLANWSFLRTRALALENIQFRINVASPTDKEKRRVTGQLTGNTKIGSFAVQLGAELFPEREKMVLTGRTTDLRLAAALDALAGKGLLGDLDVPGFISGLTIDEVNLRFSPHHKWMQVLGETTLGTIDGYFYREADEKEKDKTEFLVVLKPKRDFRLSKIDERLSLLDGIDLGKQKIVLNSKKLAKSKKKEESKWKIPSLDDMGDAAASSLRRGVNFVAELDLKKMKLDKLLKRGTLVVVTQLNSRLDGMVLEAPLGMDLELGPTASFTNIAFRLTPAPKDFAVGLAGVLRTRVGDDDLDFTGFMALGIADQSLGFGAVMDGRWTDPLGAQGITLANIGLQLGASFTAAPVILPQIGITGQLEVGDFVGGATVYFDTRNPAKSMVSASFNELPLGGIVAAMVEGLARVELNQPVKQTLNTIELSDVNFEVVPQPLTVLEQRYEQGIRISGRLSLLGWSGGALLDVAPGRSVSGAADMDPIELKSFQFRGAPGREKPQLSISINGKNSAVAANGQVSLLGITALADVGFQAGKADFKVAGKLFNKYSADLAVHGADLQDPSGMAVDAGMQGDFLNELSRKTAAKIEEVTAETRKHLATYSQLVTLAQEEVENWDRKIIAVKEMVERDQAADLAKLRRHEANVNAQQAKVNGLTRSIRQKENALKAATGWKNAAKRGKLRVEIGTLKTALGTATLGLNTYKATLIKFLETANTNPETDVRLISARAGQATARETLKLEQKKIKTLDFGLRMTGKAALFIAENGTEALLSVKSARFSGQLGSLKDMRVMLKTDLVFMNESKKVDFTLDFAALDQGVDTLVDILLERE